MKLHFEPDLDYQHAAIEAACDIFRGQEICCTEFTVTRNALGLQSQLEFAQSDLGIGNRLGLLPEGVLANVQAVQLRNGLAPSPSLASGDFTVEMETGTGKTYVYLRTIFELNRRYGFTKFVIVVPSVAVLRRHIRPAIKELGIKKRIGWHSFRHGLGTMLRRQGIDLKTAQELLRHANSRITNDLYQQAVSEEKHLANALVVKALLGDSLLQHPSAPSEGA